jgi:hypothetical protein
MSVSFVGIAYLRAFEAHLRVDLGRLVELA